MHYKTGTDMSLFNTHRREIRAPASDVGQLIDTLAGPDDRLWPRTNWYPMAFDRGGLEVGGSGGHGPVGYRVRAVEPGRSVTFEFTGRPKGLRGHHQYLVQPLDDDRCVLWHLADIEAGWPLKLTWPLFWGPLHDALIEDSLSNAQNAVELGKQARSPWNLWVRVLRAAVRTRIRRAPKSSFRDGSPTSRSSDPIGRHEGLI
ncbi:hypothetical protein ABZX12_26215 [Kribbella sp. NPDC003505]|uniref:hypothetical protein n=1 Tax=Kribbella sp. NPDC003505 TaxID=3154448 RepID=UPI0033B7CFDF